VIVSYTQRWKQDVFYWYNKICCF